MSPGFKGLQVFAGVYIALSVLCGDVFAQIHPIAFVTQVPEPDDFANIVSTFANHKATMSAAPRGGDLWIRYPDGSLKNLTQEAGYGTDGFQDENAIVVRDPAVHWDGNKILFSMAVGAPNQYDYNNYRFQLYEVTGLGKNDSPVITKVPNQPSQYNNIMGTYAPDDSIIFASDRPRNGASHLYPQLDEYESTPTNTGLWLLNPITGLLKILDHAPSGNFHPIIDSFGRVIFTRWDHLQQDQQAEDDTYGAFNYASEALGAKKLSTRKEVFPEPRSEARREKANVSLHTFNRFMPWMMNPDGTELETLNHIGRHELDDYFQQSFTNDGSLSEFIDDADRIGANEFPIDNFFTLKESPTQAGLFWGTNGSEFYTHGAGQIVTLNGAPAENANDMVVTPITHPATAAPSNSPGPAHTGLYRNPLPLSNGEVLVVHTDETRVDFNIGSRAAPKSRYKFRIKSLVNNGAYWTASSALTPGISKSLSYYDPDVLVSYSGELWELQPVEVIARPRPVASSTPLAAKEVGVFQEESVALSDFQQYLAGLNLALVITRDVRSRDEADKQQPFQLKLSGSKAITGLQFIEGVQVRAYSDFVSGRRVLPRFMQSILIPEEVQSTSALGTYRVFADGSVAAIVPAQRALSWQLVDSSGEAMVRERYWLTLQPGEVRTCFSCHGLNERDQNGDGKPKNAPEALRSLLQWWKSAEETDIRNPEDFLAPPDRDPVSRLRLKIRRARRGGIVLRLPKRFSISDAAGSEVEVRSKKGELLHTVIFPSQRRVKISLPRKISRRALLITLRSGSEIVFQKQLKRNRR